MNSFSEYVSITRVCIAVATILIVTGIGAEDPSIVIEWEEADNGAQVAQVEKWVIRKEVDLLTDKENIVLVNQAVQGEAGMFTKQPVVLILMCRGRIPAVGVNWIEHLGISFDFDDPDADERHSVKYRVLPTGTMKEKVWMREKSTTMLVGGDAKDLLKNLIEASSQPDAKFVASVKPLDEASITGVWELEGLKTAIQPFSALCAI